MCIRDRTVAICVVRESCTFSGHPYIGRIARLSLRQHGFLVSRIHRLEGSCIPHKFVYESQKLAQQTAHVSFTNSPACIGDVEGYVDGIVNLKSRMIVRVPVYQRGDSLCDETFDKQRGC